MRALSLFSGIGCFDLALAAHGVETVAGCDHEPFVARLFTQRMGAPVIPDIREVDGGICADVICGGFPCQPVSAAGLRLAQDDERWVWPEFKRVIALLQPRLVFIENVPGLRKRGLVGVLRDLHELGFDAEWDGIPAAAVGAPHIRDRIWIVAYRPGAGPVFGETWERIGRPLDVAASSVFRAGLMRGGEFFPLDPCAPVKTRRVDGWSYWTGVRLDDGVVSWPLLHTPLSSMAAVGQGGGELHKQVNHALIPTPVARDWKGQDMTAQLGTTAALGLWPTPVTTDAKGSRRSTARAAGWESNPGTTLTDAAWLGGPPLWPTPRAAESGPDYAIDDRERSGGDSLPTAVGRQERGPLNPGWVDWLMGLPVGYTDPEIPNGQLVLRGWDDEPGPRVARDVPLRRQRLTALGNALMWRVASVVVGKALQ